MERRAVVTPRQADRTLVVEIAKISEEGLVFAAEVAPQALSLPQEDTVTIQKPVKIGGLFTKVAQQVYFHGSLQGVVTVPCSRCLETVSSPFATEVRAVFFPPALPGTAVEEDKQGVTDELDLYEHNGMVLDLRPLVHDQVVLSFPIQPLCRDDCAGLCQVCGKNRNERPCTCQAEREDSPFAVLKALNIKSS
jgi:uncharacterized protein